MKTLAEPTLTAVSGEQATFKVGGEFNLVTSQDVDPDDQRHDHLRHREARIWHRPGVPAGRAVARPHQPEGPHARSRSRPPKARSRFRRRRPATGTNMLSIRKRLADTTVELPSGGSMMIAGLVRDDVRQAVNGLPGLSKIPVLGTLFRSRDFVRNETELVIIVTPYLARPVARNELAKPDDNFNAAERRRRHVPRPRQPRLRHHADRHSPTAAITASSASSTSDRGRAHVQDQRRRQ